MWTFDSLPDFRLSALHARFLRIDARTAQLTPPVTTCYRQDRFLSV